MNSKLSGPFKQYIEEYVNYKISLGYKFISEQSKLVDFDHYTFQYFSDAVELTKEIVIGFIKSKNIKNASQQTLASCLRQFACYLNKKSIQAYIIPEKMFAKREKHVPHIFTENEIKSFFETVQKNFPNDKQKANVT